LDERSRKDQPAIKQPKPHVARSTRDETRSQLGESAFAEAMADKQSPAAIFLIVPLASSHATIFPRRYYRVQLVA
jgi:hypothetical protein